METSVPDRPSAIVAMQVSQALLQLQRQNRQMHHHLHGMEWDNLGSLPSKA